MPEDVYTSSRHRLSANCQKCGKNFTPLKSNVKQGYGKFCNLVCSATRHAQPITISDGGLTAMVPLIARGGAIKAYAIIDAVDAEWVGQWRWFFDGRYVARSERREGLSFTLRLHRSLMGLVSGDMREVDHINRDRLDNRRSNLRVVDPQINKQNVPSQVGSSSRYRGVSWDKRKGKWQARAMVNRKSYTAGWFTTEREAAEAARALRVKIMPGSHD